MLNSVLLIFLFSTMVVINATQECLDNPSCASYDIYVCTNQSINANVYIPPNVNCTIFSYYKSGAIRSSYGRFSILFMLLVILAQLLSVSAIGVNSSDASVVRYKPLYTLTGNVTYDNVDINFYTLEYATVNDTLSNGGSFPSGVFIATDRPNASVFGDVKYNLNKRQDDGGYLEYEVYQSGT
ncbi:hypothetical protein V1509DRAFT_307445 [Lipomyces kononenkoae]